MNIEQRSYELDLEIRGSGDGRTICGVCVPYNREQRIHAGLTEVFLKGAFANVTRAAHRVSSSSATVRSINSPSASHRFAIVVELTE